MKINKQLSKGLFGLSNEIVLIYSSIFLWGIFILVILLAMDN